MKRVFLTFLMIIMCCTQGYAFSCLHVPSDKQDPRVFKEFFGTKLQDAIATLVNYQKNPEASGNYPCNHYITDGLRALTPQAVISICKSGGLNLSTKEGQDQCRAFKSKIANDISDEIYPARCNKSDNVKIQEGDGRTYNAARGGGDCIRIYKDIQVQIMSGRSLAGLWIQKNHPGVKYTCNKKIRKYNFQDYIQCKLNDRNIFYEFEFNDLKESNSGLTETDFNRGVCFANGKKAYLDASFLTDQGPVYCLDTSLAECERLGKDINNMGLPAASKHSLYVKDKKKEYWPEEVGMNACRIWSGFEWIKNKSMLHSAYGIDNFMFCIGNTMQFQSNSGLEDTLKSVVAKAAGVTTDSVSCAPLPGTYTGGGCAVDSKIKGVFASDDYIPCFVDNTTRIDFVFDDVSDSWDKYARGAQQAADCIVAGGQYSGERCLGVEDEQTCNIIRSTNLKNCPDCEALYWDPEKHSCVLPASKSASDLAKGVNVAVIVGSTVLGVALTLATGEGGHPFLAYALSTVETFGSTIEITSQLSIDGVADDFLVKSNRCRDEKCAEKILMEDLEEVARTSNDFNDAEYAAVDSELARLAGLLPETSVFYTKMHEGISLEKLDDGGWTDAQIWRSVGVAMEFVGYAEAFLKAFLTNGNKVRKLVKTTKMFNNKLVKAGKGVSKLSEMNTAKTVIQRNVAYAGNSNVHKAGEGIADSNATTLGGFDIVKYIPDEKVNEEKSKIQELGSSKSGGVYR